MRHILCAFCVFWVVLGCNQAQVSDQEKDIEILKRQFVAKAGLPASRLSAGMAMVDNKDGQVFLVQQYWAGHRVMVQAVIDSIYTTQPDLAAQMLARLMAAAGGEAKLHFESQLIKLGDPAVDVLVTLAKDETDWQTLMRTLDALGKIKALKGVDVMRAHLSHPNSWVRIAAAHALGDVGVSEGGAALIHALGDTSDTVVSAALVGLGKVGDLQAVRACGEKLKHKNARVRAAAVSALGRLGGAEAQGLLEPMLKDVDSGVRFKAKQALEDLMR
jgi:hypothetical protein